MRALIASGTGRYADPWHPYERTSPLLGALLERCGFTVRIRDDVDAAMRDLVDVDLLVVNAGDPWRGDSTQSAPDSSVTGLAEALRDGLGVLAMHSATASLRDYPEWAEATGAIWMPKLSWHPPAGVAEIRGLSLPDGDEVDDFTVFDERYLRLQQVGRSHVVAQHTHEGHLSPTSWVREAGRSRVAVDLLGHDERSYESHAHVELISRLARWATRRS
ncbi:MULTISPECIES: ThuA domain-containing protein [unclassified Pseudoclavibacter]|uniref:ThuA domain-containing protein n=1 Tax=unclassified Pseudoclavibacter TaxID=2615177 RepID=UPI001BA63114|nr:ThuA domain-containing protein [Pseudoclavibacter sp. Marseille-Q4354]MBS3179859.1 ThuA domain-containing protein [Pseudoclavibacter sp. Marseille-Q4354]